MADNPQSAGATALAKERDEAWERLLLASLQRTIEFLKFAEAKNGALLTFSTACIFWILKGSNTSPLGLRKYMELAPFIIAGLSALASFFPRTRLLTFFGGWRSGPHPKNLLYFGDVAGMTIAEYEHSIRERYYPPVDRCVTEAYLHDLTVQIAVNSQITRFKLRSFQIGLCLMAIAGLAFITSTVTGLTR